MISFGGGAGVVVPLWRGLGGGFWNLFRTSYFVFFAYFGSGYASLG